VDQPESVEVEGLVKRYRDFWGRARVEALKGIDLSVARGASYGLLGPNGSGKTTTMKILLGLVRPTTGSARVLGHTAGDLAARARMGFLPEESYLHPFLTGQETMDLTGRLHSIPRVERLKRSAELLDRVGLSGSVTGRRVRTYSRGMARRLGLAQALLNRPDLLLLDEPTAGLDPLAASDVKDLIREAAAGGSTVLLSSHLLGDVEDLCDGVTILEKGRVVVSGPVGDLLEMDDALEVRLENPPPDAEERIVMALEGTTGRVASARPPRRRLEDLFRELLGPEKSR
jgi:ABC-2 type transport system ATP-binding protein